MRPYALFVSALLIGCSPEKLPDAGPEFADDGTTVTDGKADSATRPVSVDTLAIGANATARFDASSHYRAYIFTGRRGQQVSLFVDGASHLDTVVYLYNTKSGKPSGRSLAYNDDTTATGWTTNSLSSSLQYSVPADGSYALVASTYGHKAVGKATVHIETPNTSLTDAQLLAAAKAYAWVGPLADDHIRKFFDSETAAYAWWSATKPTESLEWLAYDGDAEHYVSGINDLWAQRFEIDRTTGVVTLTGEH